MRIRTALLLISITAALAITGVSAQPKVSLSGKIKEGDGHPVGNAVIRIENLGYVSISSSDGSFLIDNTSAVVPKEHVRKGADIPVINNNILSFSVESPVKLQFRIYSLEGRLCNMVITNQITRGSYSMNLRGLLNHRTGCGTYIVSGIIGDKKISSKLINTSRQSAPLIVQSTVPAAHLKRTGQSGTIDRLIISRIGITTKTVDINSYESDLGDVLVTASYTVPLPEVIKAAEDSLFEVLLRRIEMLDSIKEADRLKSIDFVSVKSGFEVLLGQDSTRFKSNVGYAVSAVLALNASRKIWEIVDSIDAFIKEVDSYANDDPALESGGGLFKRTFRRNGILSLGKVLAVETPDIFMGLTQEPSFPKFMTFGYLQGAMESEILPVLDEVIAVCARIEGLRSASMKIDADGDSFEVDKGELYMFHANALLLRACLRFCCTYDMDLFASPTDSSYTWIDSVFKKAERAGGCNVLRLAGDTLLEIRVGNGQQNLMEMYRTLKYNLRDRPGFLTIRKPYHAGILNDLRSVPVKIKNGLSSIRSETDDQGDDFLTISMVNSSDGDMLDLSSELMAEGFSESFARNFSSIESLTDFITGLLNGPYAFNELIDGKQVALTIDLPVFLTNPVKDLRVLLPKYAWADEADWITGDFRKSDYATKYLDYIPVSNTEAGSDPDTIYYIGVYENDHLQMDESIIDSIVNDSWYTKCYISRPVRYKADADSTIIISPMRLTDAGGNIIPLETINEQVEQRSFFPYFNDYTFNGLFPAMTRDTWLAIIYRK